jgi:hypothetical protein
MKTRIRKLSPVERQGDLAGALFVVEPLWEGDEVDFFQWARETGQRVQIPCGLLSQSWRGQKLYGPPRVLELRALGEIVVNPFLLKIYVYSDDPEVVQEAVARFEVAVISSYNERKGADFLQPPWRERRAMDNGQ